MKLCIGDTFYNVDNKGRVIIKRVISLMENIAHNLGVELNEVFIIKSLSGTYYFTDEGLYDEKDTLRPHILNSLLNGELEIAYRHKLGEEFYYADIVEGKIIIQTYIWHNHPKDFEMEDSGLLYETQEEAFIQAEKALKFLSNKEK